MMQTAALPRNPATTVQHHEDRQGHPERGRRRGHPGSPLVARVGQQVFVGLDGRSGLQAIVEEVLAVRQSGIGGASAVRGCMFLWLVWVSGALEGAGRSLSLGATGWDVRFINHSLIVSVTAGCAISCALDGLEQRSREEKGLDLPSMRVE